MNAPDDEQLAAPGAPPDDPDLRHLLIWLQYDGTDFAGLQRQAAGVRTVSGVFEDAWRRMLDETVPARASSRTDSGVHARRLPMYVRTRRWDVPPHGLLRGLNTFLPDDVAVQAVEEVPATFHVRHDAVGKRYVYRLVAGEARSPLWRRSAWQVRGQIDLEAMTLAASHLVGVHDFQAFRASACTAKTSVRHLRTVDVGTADWPAVTVTVEGNAFLHNMVRIIAGTLVDVGRGRIAPDEVPRMLASGERTHAGQTAPAHGLTLDDVFYGPYGGRQGLDYKELLSNMEAARLRAARR